MFITSRQNLLRYHWVVAAISFLGQAGLAESVPPDATKPPVSVIGLIAKTHAVRTPTPGRFGNSLEFLFVRFLERDLAAVELNVHYRYEWLTASPDDLREGQKLLGVQTVHFAQPTAAEHLRGYQTAPVRLQVAPQRIGEATKLLKGNQFRVCLLPSPQGRYLVVDENGRLVKEMNRRWAEQQADCRLYEGCVTACLPNDEASPSERHSVDPYDLDQFVPDCYLIAALVAAARRDPQHLQSLIQETSAGYMVTFPGHVPIAVPADLDRGPDMVESRALDINSRGEVELWPIILERAYVMLRSQTKPDSAGPRQEFQDVCGGDAQHAFYVLTGRHVQERLHWNYPTRQTQLQAIQRHLETARPVMMSTGKWTQAGERPEWWREDHVYVIASVRSNLISVIDPCCGRLVQHIKCGPWMVSTEVKRFLFCE